VKTAMAAWIRAFCRAPRWLQLDDRTATAAWTCAPIRLPDEYDASTGDGPYQHGIPVTVEGTFSNSQIHGKMNGGGQPLTIRPGDGSIR